MIGLAIAKTIAAPNELAACLTTADLKFAGLADGFFRSQGWKADISTTDRFVRAVVPLAGDKDPYSFVTNAKSLQGVLRDRVRLVHIEKNGPAVLAHVGFPFPSLVIGLLHLLYGDQTLTPVFLSRDVGRDEINRMYHRNEQPVGLFDHPVYLSHFKRLVDAFIFAHHDLYHLAFGSNLPRPIRKMWSCLYDVVNALPAPARSLTVTERLLDTLTDNDVDAQAVASEEIFAFLPFRALVDRLQDGHRTDNPDEALEIYTECDRFLGALLESLGEGDHPALLHAGFLIKNLWEMRQIAETQASLRSFLSEGVF